jgi:hypothetical protein
MTPIVQCACCRDVNVRAAAQEYCFGQQLEVEFEAFVRGHIAPFVNAVREVGVDAADEMEHRHVQSDICAVVEAQSSTSTAAYFAM